MSDYPNDRTCHPERNDNCPGYLRLTRELIKPKPGVSNATLKVDMTKRKRK